MNHTASDFSAPTVKACKCGCTYTRAQWDAMPRRGLQDDDDGGFVELKNCQCGSTLGIELEKEGLCL